MVHTNMSWVMTQKMGKGAPPQNFQILIGGTYINMGFSVKFSSDYYCDPTSKVDIPTPIFLSFY